MPLTVVIRCSLLLLLGLAACSSAPKLSDDARTAHHADALIASLAQAYQAENLQGLMAGFAPTMPAREDVRRAAQDAFARFDRIELVLSIDRIHLAGNSVTVFLHWDGRWRKGVGDPLVRQGTARFIVNGGDPALVTDVIGESPFGAVPDAASLS